MTHSRHDSAAQLSTLGNVSKEDYGQILSTFLSGIDFYMPPFSYDFSLEDPVMAYFARQPNWPPNLTEKAVGMAKWMSTGLGMCYPFAEKDIQVAYGIHATYVLFIDDIIHELGNALDEFETRLVSGKPQKSPILQSLVNFLLDNDTYMGPYAAAMNTKATIEFICGCIMERDYDGKVVPPVGAKKFPSYFREKTGYTEPYAHFCFPEAIFPEKDYLHVYMPCIQDLIEFISYANDILSFYKESVVGDERLNYVCNIANTHGLSAADALGLVCKNVTENVTTVRKVLRDYPEMKDTVDEFFRGYIAWYLNQKRYKLTDIVVKDSKGQLFKLTPAEPKLLHNKRREEAKAIETEEKVARATAVEV
ncbi:terpenoid synthase [Lentithecium fluviatile CBS 122367]|uniref:Terpenoid synthase n=1 Tax=Lentithecium fluviatile CBS 122367 TaxID=1168545 RepID=A0A6G1IQW1_9PLEO|nr:terpenoid synthase [Lentithecium fluviatile CBS 122367]